LGGSRLGRKHSTAVDPLEVPMRELVAALRPFTSLVVDAEMPLREGVDSMLLDELVLLLCSRLVLAPVVPVVKHELALLDQPLGVLECRPVQPNSHVFRNSAVLPRPQGKLRRGLGGENRVQVKDATREQEGEMGMAGHTDQLRQRYHEFNRGDVEGATQDWADDFVWQGSNSTELPGGGEHKGKDQALGVLQEAVGAWDEFKLSADEFFEDGDTVVVLGHTEVKKGENSAKAPVVHVWRWRGDQIVRLQVLTDTLQVAQLLGKA
jgi:ketosteroid isomerase-like protein